MCGIYSTNIPYDRSTVEKKILSINFRGPDNLGYKKVNGVSMGHSRLSIIDLDHRSDQPMAFENLHIVYNGEIYNYITIKNELISLGYQFITTSDTEVLLIGFQAWGEVLVPKLNGMFAFCIYDSLSEKIFCARDRLGVKPFYYYWKDGQFEICSQLRPMSQSKEISHEAVSIYLDCGYIPSPYSIFKDVYKLSPGNTMVIDLLTSKLDIKEYWNLKNVVLSDLSYREAKSQLHDLIKDCVKLRLRSDVPVGCFLSGGIDSALISSIASKMSDRPIDTFCVGFEDPKFDESKIAAEFAEIIGSNHTTIICKPQDVIKLIPKFVKIYDEPFADSSALPSLLLSSVTKQYVTVVLSGDGGDESFLGYSYFNSVVRYTRFLKIPQKIRALISKLLGLKYFDNKFSHLKDILRVNKMNGLIEAIFIGHNSLQKKRNKDWFVNYNKYKNLSPNPIQKAADLNIKLWLENDSNVKVDRASMGYAVEVRSPFLDYKIVEFARNLPVAFRYKKNFQKKILRDILEEYIPKSVFNQPKRGFSIPLASWIKNELRDQFDRNLSGDFLSQIPNLDIQKFKRLYQEHMNGKCDNSTNIWRLFVLSLWYREFGYFND